MQAWCIEYEGFKPEEEGIRESLCTLGNGYFATRGAAEEADADEIHYPGTYFAGGYNRLQTQISGYLVESEDLVNCPNWLPLCFRIEDEEWFHPKDFEIQSYHQSLNMKEGLLTRKIHFKDQQGRKTRLSIKRLVSMDQPHLAAIEMKIYPENWEGRIEILSALDGRIKNAGVKRYRDLNNQHLEAIETDAFNEDGIYLQMRTSQSHMHIALASCLKLSVKPLSTSIVEESGYISQSFQCVASQGHEIEIEKRVTLYTSKDHAISECGLEAREAVKRADSFISLYDRNKLAWLHLWERFEIQVESQTESEEISKFSRLHIFHILQTTSLHSKDLDVGVPPRGWHGEAYRGHILWDELFIFSTLNLQFPELTRALLLYRYRRLPAAKRAAQKVHLRGAMYPWQSGSNGREESQRIHLNPLSGRWIPDNSSLQRHVNAAIAYNVWQHFEATGDLEFLSFYGAEMLFEISRFWVSLANYNSHSRRYEIRGVMGPDEYHDGYPHAESPGINNNTYTNIMVSWGLSRTLQALEILPQDRRSELFELMQLTDEEVEKWDEIRHLLYIPIHKDGVISQFEGYEDLKELDWEAYRKKYGDIQRLDRILEAEGDHVNHYKVSKQADVLMLFFLFSAEELRELFQKLGYQLKKETIHKTVDYYLQRTSHGSTLSRLVHSWVLSRSNRKLSWELFYDSLKSDFTDIQGGTTAEGIHLGAMAGTIDLLQRCYTGIEYRGDTLRFNPSLPEEIKRLQTVLRYRGHTLLVESTHTTLRIVSERVSAKPIWIAYRDQTFILHEGESKELNLCD